MAVVFLRIAWCHNFSQALVRSQQARKKKNAVEM